MPVAYKSVFANGMKRIAAHIFIDFLLVFLNGYVKKPTKVGKLESTLERSSIAVLHVHHTTALESHLLTL